MTSQRSPLSPLWLPLSNTSLHLSLVPSISLRISNRSLFLYPATFLISSSIFFLACYIFFAALLAKTFLKKVVQSTFLLSIPHLSPSITSLLFTPCCPPICPPIPICNQMHFKHYLSFLLSSFTASFSCSIFNSLVNYMLPFVYFFSLILFLSISSSVPTSLPLLLSQVVRLIYLPRSVPLLPSIPLSSSRQW